MKKIICIYLSFVCLLASQQIVAQETPAGSIAPLNPKYVQFIKRGGQAQGYIPSSLQYFFGNATEKRDAEALPAQYDTRNVAVLTAPRNQGNANTCWGFATLDAVQASWARMGFQTTDYSVENIVNCHGYDVTKNEGGNEDLAIAYLSRFAGPVYETSDPYINSTEGTCKQITKVDKAGIVSAAWRIPKDINIIKQMVVDHGAVFTAMTRAGLLNLNYFNPATSASFIPEGSAEESNHASTIIGWDDTYARENFSAANRPVANGAWILKGTDGANRYEQGYFYVSYEDKLVGSDLAVYPQRMEPEQIDSLYYYDRLGQTGSYGWTNIDTAYTLHKFAAPEWQSITAVGVNTAVANTTVDIEIYSKKDGNALSGLLFSKKDLLVEHPGYQSFPVDTDVEVIGQFYIRIKYKTPGYHYPIPIEMAIERATPEVMPVGYQWITYADKSSWLPVGSNSDENFNICLKVYTKNIPNRPKCASYDDIENAKELQLETLEGSFSNECATVQANEPHPVEATNCTVQNGWCPGEAKLDATLWFKFKAPASGGVQILSLGFDTQIALYDAIATGTYTDIISGNSANYRLLAANDDASDTEAAATIMPIGGLTPDKYYWIQLDGSFGGVTGDAYILVSSANVTAVGEAQQNKQPFVVNPVKDGILSIGNAQKIKQLSIFDLAGQPVKELSFANNTAENTLRIDLSELAKGSYIIKMQNGNAVLGTKIFVW
ncbi:MAG: lectin like domain-containing protein [Prevotellaceae bacterium]|jgi:C1A family cysteine protease|nr:lectin like domain-containing protein [Prevotellaceae bacterium]